MTKTQTVGLLVQTERTDGFFHVRVYPVRLDSEGPDSVRNISASSYDDDLKDCANGFYLPDLVIDSQGSSSPSHGARRLYGYELTYTPYRVTTRTATRMAKTLTTIDKRLTKLNDTRGYVRSYGEYVGRIAEVMGIGTIVRRPQRDAHLSNHAEGRWVRNTIGDGVSQIDGVIREWIEEGQAVAS